MITLATSILGLMGFVRCVKKVTGRVAVVDVSMTFAEMHSLRYGITTFALLLRNATLSTIELTLLFFMDLLEN